MASATPTVPSAIHGFLNAAGSRGPEWQSLPLVTPVAITIVLGGAYGAVMAGYHGVAGERLLMVLFGVVKIPMLFGVTMLLSVPCFYVLNLLLGVGEDFPRVWRGLVDYQLSVAIQLAALLPVTLFVNITEGNYRLAQGWSILVFAVAAWTARSSLEVCYAPLTNAGVHRLLRRFWFLVYAFVGIQMGWVLRPFVGHPDMPVQFLRDDVGNAYVEIAGVVEMIIREMLWGF